MTVGIEPWLAEQARTRLESLSFSNTTVVTGDGALGAPRQAPFDRVLLTTGTWEVFPAWPDQLKPGGRLLAPIQLGSADEQGCLVVNLTREGEYLEGKAVMGADMVPMRGEIGGVRGEEWSRAGVSWIPTATSDLNFVRVFPRRSAIEPTANQKLFVRAACQILLERPE